MKQLLTKRSAFTALVILGFILVSAAFVQIARANNLETTLTWTLKEQPPEPVSCEFDRKTNGLLIWDESEPPNDFTTNFPGNPAGLNIAPTSAISIQIITDDAHPDLRIEPQVFTSDSSLIVVPVADGFFIHKKEDAQRMNTPFYVLLQGVVLPNEPDYTPEPGFEFVYTWRVVCH